jgi:hypothetical protein
LHARSPGPQVIFRPHATNPLMQSSDAQPDVQLGRSYLHQFTDGLSRSRERPGAAQANSCAFQEAFLRGTGEPESGLHGGPRCIIRVPGPDAVPDGPITHLLPSHGHRQTRLQLKASEAPRGRFQLGAARGSACKMSAASWPFAIGRPRAHASWGGRSKLAAASFGSCAGGLNGPQRSGACCDACT